eukprot:8514674-Ditylum_brightwellii.AAC.1
MTDFDEWVHQLIFFVSPNWLEKLSKEALCYERSLNGSSDSREEDAPIDQNDNVDSFTEESSKKLSMSLSHYCI